MVFLERDLTGVAPDSMFAKHLLLLKSEADRHPDIRQLIARFHYWTAVRNSFKGTETYPHIMSSIELCDSSVYPYDMARFRMLECVLNETDIFSKYLKIKKHREYFKQTDDPYMCVTADMYLGNMLASIGDAKRAKTYFSEADSLLSTLNLSDWKVKTQLNNANVFFSLGDTTKSVEILDSLISNPAAYRDTAFLATVIINRYHFTSDTSFLIRARNFLDKKLWTDTRWGIMKALAEMYISKGDTVNSQRTLKGLLQLAKNNPDIHEYRHDAYWMGVKVSDLCGNPDSITMFCRKLYGIRDSLINRQDSYNILNNEAQSEIELNEMMMESAFKIERLILILIIISALFASGIILFIGYHTLQKHKIKELQSQMELESERRKVVSSAIVMTEKDNMIKSMITDLAEVRQSDDIPGAISRLEQNLKLHISGRQEWEEFKAVFEKVHPSFSTRLKSKFPDLTEGDIRMAVYIRSGLTSKQIARMLFLQPDSIKKNRQRLRRHLRLNPDESLEDFLRNFHFP